MRPASVPYRFSSLLLATAGFTLTAIASDIEAAKAQSAPINEAAYADRVVDYQRGESDNWDVYSKKITDSEDERWQVYDPEAALGTANWTSDMTGAGSGPWDRSIGTSLGNGGSLTVEFTDNALTGNGNEEDADLWIFEIGGVAEEMLVEISMDNEFWYEVGVADRGSRYHDYGVGFDIDSMLREKNLATDSVFSFVRVTDTGNNTYSNFKSGADIDAIAALSSVPKVSQAVPEPASIIGLMALGVVGASTLKRNKR